MTHDAFATLPSHSLKAYQNYHHLGHEHSQHARSRLAPRIATFLPGDRCCPYCDDDERSVGSIDATLTRIWSRREPSTPDFMSSPKLHVALDAFILSAFAYRAWPSLKPHLRYWQMQMRRDVHAWMGLVGYVQYQATQQVGLAANQIAHSFKQKQRPLQVRTYHTDSKIKRRSLHALTIGNPTPLALFASTLHPPSLHPSSLQIPFEPEQVKRHVETSPAVETFEQEPSPQAMQAIKNILSHIKKKRIASQATFMDLIEKVSQYPEEALKDIVCHILPLLHQRIEMIGAEGLKTKALNRICRALITHVVPRLTMSRELEEAWAEIFTTSIQLRIQSGDQQGAEQFYHVWESMSPNGPGRHVLQSLPELDPNRPLEKKDWQRIFDGMITCPPDMLASIFGYVFPLIRMRVAGWPASAAAQTIQIVSQVVSTAIIPKLVGCKLTAQMQSDIAETLTSRIQTLLVHEDMGEAKKTLDLWSLVCSDAPKSWLELMEYLALDPDETRLGLINALVKLQRANVALLQRAVVAGSLDLQTSLPIYFYLGGHCLPSRLQQGQWLYDSLSKFPLSEPMVTADMLESLLATTIQDEELSALILQDFARLHVQPKLSIQQALTSLPLDGLSWTSLTQFFTRIHDVVPRENHADLIFSWKRGVALRKRLTTRFGAGVASKMYQSALSSFCLVFAPTLQELSARTPQLFHKESAFQHLASEHLLHQGIVEAHNWLSYMTSVGEETPEHLWIEAMRQWCASGNVVRIAHLLNMRLKMTFPARMKFIMMAVTAFARAQDVDTCLALYVHCRRGNPPANGVSQEEWENLLTVEAKKLYYLWTAPVKCTGMEPAMLGRLCNVFSHTPSLLNALVQDVKAYDFEGDSEFVFHVRKSVDRKDLDLTNEKGLVIMAKLLNELNQQGRYSQVLKSLLEILAELDNGPHMQRALHHFQVPWLNALAGMKDWPTYESTLELLEKHDVDMSFLVGLSHMEYLIGSKGLDETMEMVSKQLKQQLDSKGIYIKKETADDALIALLIDEPLEMDGSDAETLTDEVIEVNEYCLSYPALRTLVLRYCLDCPQTIDRYRLAIVCTYLARVKGMDLTNGPIPSAIQARSSDDFDWRLRLASVRFASM
jgi:hypothetical protein